MRKTLTQKDFDKIKALQTKGKTVAQAVGLTSWSDRCVRRVYKAKSFNGYKRILTNDHVKNVTLENYPVPMLDGKKKVYIGDAAEKRTEIHHNETEVIKPNRIAIVVTLVVLAILFGAFLLWLF